MEEIARVSPASLASFRDLKLKLILFIGQYFLGPVYFARVWRKQSGQDFSKLNWICGASAASAKTLHQNVKTHSDSGIVLSVRYRYSAWRLRRWPFKLPLAASSCNCLIHGPPLWNKVINFTLFGSRAMHCKSGCMPGLGKPWAASHTNQNKTRNSIKFCSSPGKPWYIPTGPRANKNLNDACLKRFCTGIGACPGN